MYSRTSPADIPVVKNEKGSLIVNAKIAQGMNLDIPYEMVESAEEVIQ